MSIDLYIKQLKWQDAAWSVVSLNCYLSVCSKVGRITNNTHAQKSLVLMWLAYFGSPQAVPLFDRFCTTSWVEHFSWRMASRPTTPSSTTWACLSNRRLVSVMMILLLPPSGSLTLTTSTSTTMLPVVPTLVSGTACMTTLRDPALMPPSAPSMSLSTGTPPAPLSLPLSLSPSFPPLCSWSHLYYHSPSLFLCPLLPPSLTAFTSTTMLLSYSTSQHWNV